MQGGRGRVGGTSEPPLMLRANLEAPACHRNCSHRAHQRSAQASCFCLIRKKQCRSGEWSASVCREGLQLGDGPKQESQRGGKHGRHVGNGHGSACAQNSGCREDAKQLARRVVPRAADGGLGSKSSREKKGRPWQSAPCEQRPRGLTRKNTARREDRPSLWS